MLVQRYEDSKFYTNVQLYMSTTLFECSETETQNQKTIDPLVALLHLQVAKEYINRF